MLQSQQQNNQIAPQGVIQANPIQPNQQAQNQIYGVQQNQQIQQNPNNGGGQLVPALILQPINNQQPIQQQQPQPFFQQAAAPQQQIVQNNNVFLYEKNNQHPYSVTQNSDCHNYLQYLYTQTIAKQPIAPKRKLDGRIYKVDQPSFACLDDLKDLRILSEKLNGSSPLHELFHLLNQIQGAQVITSIEQGVQQLMISSNQSQEMIYELRSSSGYLPTLRELEASISDNQGNCYRFEEFKSFTQYEIADNMQNVFANGFENELLNKFQNNNHPCFVIRTFQSKKGTTSFILLKYVQNSWYAITKTEAFRLAFPGAAPQNQFLVNQSIQVIPSMPIYSFCQMQLGENNVLYGIKLMAANENAYKQKLSLVLKEFYNQDTYIKSLYKWERFMKHIDSQHNVRKIILQDGIFKNTRNKMHQQGSAHEQPQNQPQRKDIKKHLQDNIAKRRNEPNKRPHKDNNKYKNYRVEKRKPKKPPIKYHHGKKSSKRGKYSEQSSDSNEEQSTYGKSNSESSSNRYSSSSDEGQRFQKSYRGRKH